MAEVTKLMEALVGAGDSTGARLEAVSGWWARLATESSLVVLAAEYLTSTFHDAEQIAANRDVIERVKESARVLLEDTLPEEISKTDPRIDDAIDGFVSTGTGVAIAQAMGLYDGAQGAALMVTTLRMWLAKLGSDSEAVAS